MVDERREDPGGLAARVADLESTLDSLRQDSEVAHVLLGLAGVLAELRSVEETLDMAVRVIPELLGADRCFAAQRTAGVNRFEVIAHAGFTEAGLQNIVEVAGRENGMPVLAEAIEQRAPLLIPDVVADGRIPRESIERRGLGSYIVLPLVRWGQEFGGIGLEFDAPRNFFTKETALARGIARQVSQALVNARRFNLLAGLRDFGQRVAPMLTMGAVIDAVGAGAQDLLRGDAASVYFLDTTHDVLVAPPGSLRGVPDDADLGRIDMNAEPWRPLREGRHVLVPDLLQEAEGNAEWGAVGVPLSGEDASLMGAVIVFFKRGLTLAPDEAEALSVLAGQAARSIENAKRFERQRRMARSLQEGLLLNELPDIKGCTLGAVYDAASGETDIGGDFYDAFDLPDGRFGLVVGDVSGKGAEAAARTAMAKYMLRAFAIRNPAPSSVLFHLNNALAHDLEEERFATLVYLLLDPARRRCTFGLGGHPPPLIYRHEVGKIETVELQGPILGAFEDQQYQQETYELGPRDLYLAFTDGLIEARSSGGVFYGRRPIERGLLQHAPELEPQPLVERLLEDAKAFGALSDDTVLFALRCGGAK